MDKIKDHTWEEKKDIVRNYKKSGQIMTTFANENFLSFHRLMRYIKEVESDCA